MPLLLQVNTPATAAAAEHRVVDDNVDELETRV